MERQHRAFNQNGPRAAHRVIQRVVRTQMRKRAKRRRQGLAHRRIIRRGAVSAFVQRHTRSVDTNTDLIFEDGKIQASCTCFFEPIFMIYGFQPFYGGLFNNCLAVADTVQIRLQTVALDREFIVFANPIFQRQFFHALKQVFKGMRRKPPEYQKNPLGKSGADVGARQYRLVPRKKYPSVFRGNILCAHFAQFLCHKTFQAKQTRCRKIQMHLLYHS